MPRSPLVTSDDWPESELRAAVLAGELVAIGPCWASPAEPQTPSLRAAAVHWAVQDPRLIAGTRTAAWIWGAVSRAPVPLEVSVTPQVRVHAGVSLRVREVTIAAEDLVLVADLRVTTPLRTAVDLLRSPAERPGGFGRDESIAAAGLLITGLVTAEDVRVRLRSLGTIPMARQADRRLRELEAAAAPAPTGAAAR